jgi:iron(III) transport system ATP-binding protein
MAVDVKFESVTKILGESKAVDNLTVEIGAGELFFLLGPSGCGKTTALRLVAGFYKPDEGRILFNDKDQSRVAPHKRNTGMVFQNYALWPHMDVWSNVAYGLKMRRVSDTEKRQRVSRALVIEPDVVLLDEPLSNLDAKLRVEMRTQIKDIHRKIGRTMIYVTHDQAEALSMADRIAVMRRGRVVQAGTPHELYTRPESAFVAEFIGGTNLLRGTLEEIGDLLTVKTDAGIVRAKNGVKGIVRGEPVFCSVRPESLRLAPATESSGPTDVTNRLVAEVQSMMYLGDNEQYALRLADNTTIRAVEYNPCARRANLGEQIVVQFDPAAVVVLPQEDLGD